MKRIVSIILTAAILITVVFCSALNANAAKSVYSSVIAGKYAASLKSYDYELKESKAFFYDYDGNKAKELVTVLYSKKGMITSHNLYIYTSKKGRVVTLVNGAQLGVDAGQGVSTKIGVAINKASGKKYVSIQWTYGGGENFQTVRYYYMIKGAKVVGLHKAIIKVHYDWGTDDSTATYYINGVKKTKAAFDKWTNAYKYSLYNTTLKSIYGKTR